MTDYRVSPTLWTELQEFECVEAGEEAMNVDVHPKPVHLQHRSKDQAKELIEFNLVKERREAQPFFISASLSADLKQVLLELLRKFKDVLYGHTLRCIDLFCSWSCIN